MILYNSLKKGRNTNQSIFFMATDQQIRLYASSTVLWKKYLSGLKDNIKNGNNFQKKEDKTLIMIAA